MKIKYIISSLILIGTVFLLSGCGPMYSTSYEYLPPQTMQARQCVMQCSQTQSMCDMACNAQYSQCQTSAKLSGMQEYMIYRQDRIAQGRPVKRDIDSFVNTWGCSKSCGCKPKYDQCFTMCGGRIIPHTRCVAFCDQQGQQRNR